MVVQPIWEDNSIILTLAFILFGLCRQGIQFYTFCLFGELGGNLESWGNFVFVLTPSLSFFFINITPLVFEFYLFWPILIVVLEEALVERITFVFYRFKWFNKMIPLIQLIIQFCCTKNLFIYINIIYIYIYIIP